MSKSSKKYFVCGVVTGLLTVVLVTLLVYRIPSVKHSMDWRLDVIKAFVRGVIRPVTSVPTPITYQSHTSSEPQKSDLFEVTSTPEMIKTEPGGEEQPVGSIPTMLPTVDNVNLPDSARLETPRYESQDWNNCGPVTLSHYLRYYDWDGDQFDISDHIKPVRADRNVNVDEMVHFVSENVWWLNAIYRVGGDINLLKHLLSSGFPVMIEESFYLEDRFWFNDDRWSGHYLLLTGYDDTNEIFFVQDPLLGPDRMISYSDLENKWQSFNRVYILIYKTEEQEKVKSILGIHWDVERNRQIALERSESETQQQPDNPYAWFNYGTNMLYFEKYTEAALAYDEAGRIGLPQRMFRYQFGPFLAYFHSGRIDELQATVEYALQITPNSEEALLWNGWLLYRQGNKQKALSNFEEALQANPGYIDAIYALDYVLNN